MDAAGVRGDDRGVEYSRMRMVFRMSSPGRVIVLPPGVRGIGISGRISAGADGFHRQGLDPPHQHTGDRAALHTTEAGGNVSRSKSARA